MKVGSWNWVLTIKMWIECFIEYNGDGVGPILPRIQVLKANIFLNEDFLEVNLGYNINISFVWLRIHISWVLIKGLRWRAGNGENVRAWTDPWLRLDNSFAQTTLDSMPTLKVGDFYNYDLESRASSSNFYLTWFTNYSINAFIFYWRWW